MPRTWSLNVAYGFVQITDVLTQRVRHLELCVPRNVTLDVQSSNQVEMKL